MEMNGLLHTLAALEYGRNPGIHQIGLWVGPSTGLDILEKRKISCFIRIPTPDCPRCSAARD